MFIEPMSIRNCSLFSFPEIFEPIIAACELPSPGKKEHIGETIAVVIAGFNKSFFWKSIFSIICSGTFVFFLIELISVDEPNNPDRSGRSGSFISRFSEAIPRNPASKKIIRDSILKFFSPIIKNIEIQIKKKAIIFSMNG